MGGRGLRQYLIFLPGGRLDFRGCGGVDYDKEASSVPDACRAETVLPIGSLWQVDR